MRRPFSWLFAVNTGISALPALGARWISPETSWRDAWEIFLVGATHANLIAGMANLLFTRMSPRMQRWNRVSSWSFVLGSLFVLSLVGSTLATSILILAGVFPASYWQAAWITSMKYSILITMTFGLGTSVFFQIRSQLEDTTLALRTRELEKERALKLASEARLQSLESRVHPHFLFNALNSVSALIREDPERAERQIERISRFLRYALDRASQRAVSIEEELRMVRDYLEIEQTRFGDRLRFRLEADPGAASAEIPPMAIQTLVENSVKYAIAPRREGGEIRVHAARSGSRFRIDVWDDGPGFDPAHRLSGHGLDLLGERLQTLYGQAGALRFENGRGMTVTVEVPCARS